MFDKEVNFYFVPDISSQQDIVPIFKKSFQFFDLDCFDQFSVKVSWFFRDIDFFFYFHNIEIGLSWLITNLQTFTLSQQHMVNDSFNLRKNTNIN